MVIHALVLATAEESVTELLRRALGPPRRKDTSHSDENAGVEGGPILVVEVVRAIILIEAFNCKFSAGKFGHFINPSDCILRPGCPPLAEPQELTGIVDDANHGLTRAEVAAHESTDGHSSERALH